MIDYRVTYKGEFESDYTVFSEGVVLTSHTVIGLTPSYRYYFQVEARNLVGYSAKSAEILVLAAQIPDAPTDLANVPEVTTANQIGLKWLAPVFDGGSSVLDYSIWFDDASNGVTYTALVSGLQTLTFTASGL